MNCHVRYSHLFLAATDTFLGTVSGVKMLTFVHFHNILEGRGKGGALFISGKFLAGCLEAQPELRSCM